MNKWQWVVAGFYGVFLVILTVPVLLAAFGGGFSGELFGIYAHWPYWFGIAVLIMAQAAFLSVPVCTQFNRPQTRRPVWLTVLAASFMIGLLGGGLFLTVAEMIVGKGFPDNMLWFRIAVVVLVTTWVVWTAVFYRWSRTSGSAAPFWDRSIRVMYRGSILGLLVAVPAHVVARHRDDCCGGLGTIWGIASGLAVMLFAFGPGVFFLFAERWGKLHRGKGG